MADSGTMARVEHVTDTLDRVLATLDRLGDRIGDLRVELVACRADIANVRALVDGVHSRADKIETEHKGLAERVGQLEQEAAEHRGAHERGRMARVGMAAGSGGAVTAIAELVRYLVGGLS